MSDVTRILNAIEQGDGKATEELLPLVYQELRLLAAQKLSHEKPGQTLQATALVHEAYLRLLGPEATQWRSRPHFFHAAAEAMRRILIDNARRKQSLKHGGNHRRVELNEDPAIDHQHGEDLLALNDALERLEQHDSTAAELIKLRYFSGLTLEQVAQVQGYTRRTASNHWAYARAWLHRELNASTSREE
jgi:RNA polymerase sigma factor (TIGR02999 family)